MIKNETVDVVRAVYLFLKEFTAPEIEESRIIYGNQNNVTLPKDNNFIIFYQLSNQRVGTGSETWQPKGDEVIEITETVQTQFQVDCYSSAKQGAKTAMLRAQGLETVCRSSVGAIFLKRLGVGLIGSDSCRNMTSVGDSALNVSRWTLTIDLSFNSKIKVSEAFFEKVRLKEIANVDVKFKP